jgi:uncharacterized membrane protein YfcA
MKKPASAAVRKHFGVDCPRKESNMNEILPFLLLGFVAGALSGLIGIGGGVVIVPALVFLFGFSQHKAEGTTLALLVPPVGVLAVLPYFKQGFVDIRSAAFMCLGFLFGGLIGGHLATGLSNMVLQRVFAIALLMIGIRMLFAR